MDEQRASRIICLEGPSAVGKTTLGARLAAECGAALVGELDPSDAPPIAESAEWFVDRHARQWREARDFAAAAPFAVMDGDPFKGLWYNWMHAAEGWEGIDVVAPLYRRHLEQGTISFPDLYFVLGATEAQLRERRTGDATRSRRGFEKHVLKRGAQRRYFAALQAADPARVMFLDTADRGSLVAQVSAAVQGASTRRVEPAALLAAMANWIREAASCE